MAKKGRPPNHITVPDHVCPGCGVTITGVEIAPVTDVAAVPAKRHYEVVKGPQKGAGGLFDGKGSQEGEAE